MLSLIPASVAYIFFGVLYFVYLRYRKTGKIGKRADVFIITLLILFILCLFAWGISRNFDLPFWAKK